MSIAFGEKASGEAMSDVKDVKEDEVGENDSVQVDRRKFLADAGRFSVSVPPTMVVLLSTTMNSSAIAQSGGSVIERVRPRPVHTPPQERPTRRSRTRRSPKGIE
jgi:hypothetical protein